MSNNLDKYFIKNPETPAHVKDDDPDKWEKLKANSKKRGDKALEQIMKPPVFWIDVFNYVNEFFELLKTHNSDKKKTNQMKYIELDNRMQPVLENGIFAFNCCWTDCVYDQNIGRYTYYDHKYDIIKSEFELCSPNDIIWLKFTTDGYLGVVASGFDINFSYECTSGRLVNSVGKKWYDKCVLIFPLTKDILSVHNKKDMETAVGNFLIDKGVPIIDFYSHGY